MKSQETAIDSPGDDLIIRYSDVCLSFDRNGAEIPVLEDVTFDVPRGKFVSIVGPSGCGKSTLLNLTAGLYAPRSGLVRYDGREVEGVNTRVGYVTQDDHLMPWRTVRRNLETQLEIAGVKREERRQLAQRQIELFQLTSFENHYPAELSGGMRKRASLARTMIYEPETILMDEPFGSLDAQLRTVMQQELLNMTYRLPGTTVVFVTHDLIEAVLLSDIVVVLSRRPARIRRIENIPFEHPRDIDSLRFDPEVREIHDGLWGLLKGDLDV